MYFYAYVSVIGGGQEFCPGPSGGRSQISKAELLS